MRIITVALIFVLLNVSVFAQDKSDKKSNLNLSFSERIRVEMSDNTADLNNLGTGNSTYMRFKTSFGLQWNISGDVLFNGKLTNEFRKYLTPKSNPFHWNEIFFDNLYLKVNNFLGGALTIGRQDIKLGEGFVVLDGTPADGSRSIYFNAVKYDWKIDNTNSLTIFGAYQPYEDKLLPVLNGHDIESSSQSANTYRVVEQTETGLAAYYTGLFGKTNFQGYYIYKKINLDEKKIVPESNIHTLGARVAVPLSGNLSFTAEGAYQFGTIGDFNRSAYGGYAYLDYQTELKEGLLPKTVTVGTILLSGDDTSTPDYEGWDPVFSRWPKWSDSYIYILPKEFGRGAYWSNFFDLYVKLEFALMQNLGLSLQNHFLMSPQKSAKTSFLSGDGTSRGNLTIMKFAYKMNDNTTGHFIWEHLEPGSYYFNGANNYNWFRFELLFSF